MPQELSQPAASRGVKEWLASAVVRRLPGKVQQALRRIVRPSLHTSRFTNLFHCTTQKAGSQWIRAVLCDPRVRRHCGLAGFDYEASLPGGHDPRRLADKRIAGPFPARTIATPLYLGYAAYRDLEKPPESRAVFVVRDPRDLVVSHYFSVRYSHPLMGNIREQRVRLEKLTPADGLRQTLVTLADYGTFDCQRSWQEGAAHDPTVLLVRFEDLIGDRPQVVWQRLFQHFDIQMTTAVLAQLLQEHSFESRAGRKRGDEDRQSHFRKGVHGDWKNHFDERLVEEFKRYTGDLVMALGYESSDGW